MGEAAKPSDDERLAAIRAHFDESMRYHATVYLRENEEDRELTAAYMGIIANVLALVDGDRLDLRGVLENREVVIQRYLEQARSDPYEPGNCSFCGERPIAAWFEGPDFRSYVERSADVRAEEAWLACSTCLALVEADDREALVRRGTARVRRRGRGVADDMAESSARRRLNEGFWGPRDRS